MFIIIYKIMLALIIVILLFLWQAEMSLSAGNAVTCIAMGVKTFQGGGGGQRAYLSLEKF